MNPTIVTGTLVARAAAPRAIIPRHSLYCSDSPVRQFTNPAIQASLTVDDDGPGIAPEERETIFEPFVRLDPSRDRATGGCGLGLAIVYSIAQAMGGTVHCEASELGGARFCFSWPVYHNITLPVPA